MLTPPLDEEQMKHLQAVSDGLSPTTAAWLSGYFWRMAETSSPTVQSVAMPNVAADTLAATPDVVTIISASQTGNARQVAEQLRDALTANDIPVELIAAGSYKFKQINKARLLVIVTSTQGEGEPPEEAFALHKFVMSKKAPELNQTAFAVFGLGDSSYEHFCQAGKDFDERLATLGAERLLERVDVDVEFAKPAARWCGQVVDVLKTRTASAHTTSAPTPATQGAAEAYNKQHPLTATLSVNQKITGRHSDKDVRHLEIDLGEAGLDYQPGDALGIWYENDPALVDELLEALTLSGNTHVHLDGDTLTLRDALLTRRELTVNSIPLIQRVAEFGTSDTLHELASQDRSALQRYAERTPLVDMLIEAKCTLTAEKLIDVLRPLTPRLYSIASSQADVDDEVHITVAVVRYEYKGNTRTGGASAYLAERIEEDGPVRVFVERNDNFRLPENNATPIIMIGAGTGVAPYRAFMQQRAHEEATGKNWLFFGNPHFTEDFLYQTEWQSYVHEGVLHRIDLAWSRDQAEKVYVQDRIRHQGEAVWQWLCEGAYVYVCGDAQRMAKDVEQALLDVLMQQGGMTADDADDYLTELRLARRYQRDIY